jgi:hypothetical protein
MGWWTNAGKADLLAGGIAGREFRALLVTTAPASAAVAADLNTVSQVTANEIAGQRQTLSGMTVIEDDTNDRAALDANDPAQYTGMNGPVIVGLWVYRRITNGADADATDKLWAFLALTPNITTNSGPVNITFSATGIATIT